MRAPGESWNVQVSTLPRIARSRFDGLRVAGRWLAAVHVLAAARSRVRCRCGGSTGAVPSQSPVRRLRHRPGHSCAGTQLLPPRFAVHKSRRLDHSRNPVSSAAIEPQRRHRLEDLARCGKAAGLQEPMRPPRALTMCQRRTVHEVRGPDGAGTQPPPAR